MKKELCLLCRCSEIYHSKDDIMEGKAIVEFFVKQTLIRDTLTDQENWINELLIGWGAGGAKSFTWWMRLAYMCIQYPWTRRWLWRAKLKTLKRTTLKTLKEKVLKPFFWMEEWSDYRITWSNDNSSPNSVVFNNWSEIVLVDLKHYPSLDPDFDDLWSLELTGWFIDEIAQIIWKAYQVFNSRCWRRRNEEFWLKKMMLSSCNPSKARPYQYFYKPRKAWTLPKHIAFIPVLAKDNPYIDKSYIEWLWNMPEGAMKQRLLYWNRDYGDDTYTLYSRDDLMSMTTNIWKGGERYLVIDPAWMWKDTTRIYVFEWFRVLEMVREGKSTPESVKTIVRHLADTYWIKRRNWIYDGVGLGRGLSSLDCKVFHGWNPAIEDKRKKSWSDIQEGAVKRWFKNIRSQCFYELSKPIKEWRISIPSWIEADDFQTIVEELETIQHRNIDKDWPLEIIPKKDIKKLIWRSPDDADVLCMRMFFELDKKPLPSFK